MPSSGHTMLFFVHPFLHTYPPTHPLKHPTLPYTQAWSACLITAVHLHCTHLHQPNNALTLLTSSIHTHVSIATPNMRYTWQLCVLHIIKAVQQHAGTVQQHAGNNAQSAQQYDAGVVLSAAVQCMQQLHPLEACVMADMHVILGERGVGNTGLEENDVHKVCFVWVCFCVFCTFCVLCVCVVPCLCNPP